MGLGLWLVDPDVEHIDFTACGDRLLAHDQRASGDVPDARPEQDASSKRATSDKTQFGGTAAERALIGRPKGGSAEAPGGRIRIIL